MKKKHKRSRKKPAPSLHRWTGEGVLLAVGRINSLILAQLAQMAKNPTVQGGPLLGLPLWDNVGPRACERITRCPVLLVDLDFESPERWHALRGQTTAPLRSSQLCFPASIGGKLLREILLEVRSHARSAPYAVRFGFGMAPEVSRSIAELSIGQIDLLAELHAGHLAVRWSNHRRFWSHLVEAVCGTDDSALATVFLHAVQLLGGDFILQEFRDHSTDPSAVAESQLRH